MKNLVLSVCFALIAVFSVSCTKKEVEADNSIKTIGAYSVSRFEQNGTVVTLPKNGASAIITVQSTGINQVKFRFQMYVNSTTQLDETLNGLTVERNTDTRYSFTVSGQPIATLTGDQLVIDAKSGNQRGTWVANR